MNFSMIDLKIDFIREQGEAAVFQIGYHPMPY